MLNTKSLSDTLEYQSNFHKNKVIKILTDGLESRKCITDQVDSEFRQRYRRQFYRIDQLAFLLVPLIEKPLKNQDEEMEMNRLYDEIQKLLDEISYLSDTPEIQTHEYLESQGYLKQGGIFGERKYFEI